MKPTLITLFSLLLSAVLSAQNSETVKAPDGKFIGLTTTSLKVKTKTEGAKIVVVSGSTRLEGKTKSLDPLAVDSFFTYGDDVIFDGDSVSITVTHPDFLPNEKKIPTKEFRAIYYMMLKTK